MLRLNRRNETAGLSGRFPADCTSIELEHWSCRCNDNCLTWLLKKESQQEFPRVPASLPTIKSLSTTDQPKSASFSILG